jgi:lipopolysaccharide transport system ATP-binding protein
MLVIELKDVCKKFKYYSKKHMTLKETLIKRNKGIYTEFYALKDVTLSVHEGECWGIMGFNGAGKTTLFKLISKILIPTSGTIRTKGRISAILDLGVGFHADFTGIENIYTYGAILGLKQKEINKNLDSIIDFSGIKEFVEEPLRSYSSGMIARLGFSVAVHVSPDILLLDEILTVGDSAFQKKCLTKLKEIKEQGKTILMISHSPQHLLELCPNSIIIHKHELFKSGSSSEMAEAYLKLTESAEMKAESSFHGYPLKAQEKNAD